MPKITGEQVSAAEWSGLAAAVPFSPVPVGYYYGTGTGSAAATTHANGYLYGAPLGVAEVTSFDRIGIEITAAVAGALVRLGVFSNVGDLPSAPLVDSGQLDASTTGFKEAVISLTLQPGVYWLAAVNQGGTSVAGVRSTSGSAHVPGSTGASFGISVASQFQGGVLTTWTNHSTSTVAPPRVVLRRSA